MDLKKYAALKEKVESLHSQRDRAQGALDQLHVELKRDFGCKTLEEAKEKLGKLSKEQAKLEREFTQALEAFETKYAPLLEEE